MVIYGNEVSDMINVVNKLKNGIVNNKVKSVIFALVGLFVVASFVFGIYQTYGKQDGGKSGNDLLQEVNDEPQESEGSKVSIVSIHEVEPEEVVVSSPVEQNMDIVEESMDELDHMRWPGDGEVVTNYGFAYSETFEDNRFHKGIDIILSPGYEVRSVLSGIITNISSSDSWGDVITIQHYEGFETKYMGVKPAKSEVGISVDQGDVIGVVTVSPNYEAKIKPHLHFEVYENGKAVDPLIYLKPIEN